MEHPILLCPRHGPGHAACRDPADRHAARLHPRGHWWRAGHALPPGPAAEAGRRSSSGGAALAELCRSSWSEHGRVASAMGWQLPGDEHQGGEKASRLVSPTISVRLWGSRPKLSRGESLTAISANGVPATVTVAPPPTGLLLVGPPGPTDDQLLDALVHRAELDLWSQPPFAPPAGSWRSRPAPRSRRTPAQPCLLPFAGPGWVSRDRRRARPLSVRHVSPYGCGHAFSYKFDPCAGQLPATAAARARHEQDLRGSSQVACKEGLNCPGCGHAQVLEAELAWRSSGLQRAGLSLDEVDRALAGVRRGYAEGSAICARSHPWPWAVACRVQRSP